MCKGISIHLIGIYMNNILKYRGYRFYQSLLMILMKRVRCCRLTMTGPETARCTYAGYMLMVLGMVFSLINRNSRFRGSSRKKYPGLIKRGKNCLSFFVLFFVTGFAWSPEALPQQLPLLLCDSATCLNIGKLLVQDNAGRIKPINTMSSEVLRKSIPEIQDVQGLTAWPGHSGMLVDPGAWGYEPIIRTTIWNKEILGSDEKYFSFGYIFHQPMSYFCRNMWRSFQEKTGLAGVNSTMRSQAWWRVNIAYLVFTGEMLHILPAPMIAVIPGMNYQCIQGKTGTEDSVFTENVIPFVYRGGVGSLKSAIGVADQSGKCNICVSNQSYKDIIPSPAKLQWRFSWNKALFFSEYQSTMDSLGCIFPVLLRYFTLAGIVSGKVLKLQVPVIISIYW